MHWSQHGSTRRPRSFVDRALVLLAAVDLTESIEESQTEEIATMQGLLG